MCYYNADNHVISLSFECCRKKCLHTSVPISHFETLLLFCLFYSFNIRDEQNRDILNILKYFRRGEVFLISMKQEQSRAGNGEPGAE